MPSTRERERERENKRRTKVLMGSMGEGDKKSLYLNLSLV